MKEVLPLRVLSTPTTQEPLQLPGQGSLLPDAASQSFSPPPAISAEQKLTLIPGVYFQKNFIWINKKVTEAL